MADLSTAVTRFGIEGGIRSPHGDFSLKITAPSGKALGPHTIFGIGGGIWNRLGGDYSNKVAGTQPETPTVSSVGTSMSLEQFRELERRQREAQRRARMIALDDDEVLNLLM